MPESTRDDYLARLEALLPFPPDRRAEIVEEIAAHLDDAVVAGRSRADAQARLGTPEALADELSRPERSPVRLLAAAGAGVRAAVGPWIYGYVLASLLTFVGFLLVAVHGTLAGRLLRLELSIGADGGWNTTLTAIPLATALYFAARAATRAAAVTSRHLATRVRPWVAVAGTLLSGWILLFVMEAAQSPASVVALSLVPLAATAGAYRPTLLPVRPRVPWVVIVGIVALIPLGVLVSTVLPPTSNVGAEVPASAWERRTDIVGPTWQPPTGTPLFGSQGWSTTGAGIEAEWYLEDTAALASFSELRLEAWHVERGSDWRLDARHDAPFAVAPATREEDRLIGTVRTDRDPWVHRWELVLTGVGADGTRYVLDASGGGQSSFTGTAADWVRAAIGLR